MLSMSDELLLLVSDRPLTFPSIREIMQKVGGYTNRKVIWSTLARLAQRGYLKKTKRKEGIEFSLTASGKKEIPPDPVFIQRPQRAWDSKWRLVLFDIPEEKRKSKEQFLSGLKEMGFGRIQNSVYVSVHDVIDKVKNLAKSQGISEQINVMLVEELGIDDERKFAQGVWNLEKLAKKYKEFVERNKNGYQGAEFTSDILRYWLKKTRYEYLSILHEDPLLPKELLPSGWMGYEAQKVWEQMEEILRTY